MEAAIEKRLTALEERLGLPPYDGSKTDADIDVLSLRKKISELGYGFILKTDPEVLKKLCSLASNVSFIKKFLVVCQLGLF